MRGQLGQRLAFVRRGWHVQAVKLTTLPSPEKLAEYCKAKGIARLELFGSAVRDDFDPEESDIDLLVDYEPGRHPGLDHFQVAEELSELFGRKVDLNTAAMLGRHHSRVRHEGELLYGEA